MEEFENLTESKSSSTPKPTTEVITIGRVKVELLVDPDEDYSTVTTAQDLVNLDSKKPGIIKSITPKLYPAFASSVNKTLESHVEIGDNVRYKTSAAIPVGSDGETIYEVVDLELVGLTDMTAFVARLSNGDLVLTLHLKKV